MNDVEYARHIYRVAGRVADKMQSDYWWLMVEAESVRLDMAVAAHFTSTATTVPTAPRGTHEEAPARS